MARSGSSRAEISYLPAAHAQKEAQHIGLLLLLELFDVFEGTHLHKELARGDGVVSLQAQDRVLGMIGTWK
jgi:hypothetical protein